MTFIHQLGNSSLRRKINPLLHNPQCLITQHLPKHTITITTTTRVQTITVPVISIPQTLEPAQMNGLTKQAHSNTFRRIMVISKFRIVAGAPGLPEEMAQQADSGVVGAV